MSSEQGPQPASDAIRQRFQRQRRRATAPELALRKELHRRGLRFRVDAAAIPKVRSNAGLLFPGQRVAVFVNGCLWHGCPEHGTTPKNNGEWWQAKLGANRAHDERVDVALCDAGWLPLRIWEHEPAADAADRVENVIRARSRR